LILSTYFVTLPFKYHQMKFKLICVFLLVFGFSSCKNDNEKRQEESINDCKKKELFFSAIEKSWIFNTDAVKYSSKSASKSWNSWQIFLVTLEKKPRKSLSAFQKKAADISKKAMALNDNIPIEFDKPQIKTRIAVLITKVRMLDMYIHLKNIPSQKITALIPEINSELISLQNQMDIIVQKNKIPKEDGETELLQMLDTTRAIQN
jgi:hypothetical protein